MKRAIVCSLALSSLCTFGAEDVGRKLNWQTMGAPTYVDPSMPDRGEPAAEDEYRLPQQSADTASNELSAAPKVFIREIRVTGVTAFAPEVVRTWTAPFENRDVTPEELQSLRLSLSRLYLEHGYVNSGVTIPDQRVQDGVVVLQAIEGSLSRIEIEGEPRLRESYIDRRLTQRIETPLDLDQVRTALQHLRMDPRIERLEARLTPGDALGQSVLRIGIVEPPPFEVAVTADNHRPSSVGAERARLAMNTHNLTGFGEELRLAGAISEGSNDWDASFSVPVTRWNTSVQTYYSASDQDIVEDAFQDLDINSETDTLGVAVNQPLIDTLANTLSVMVGFEAKHSKSELAGDAFSFSPGAIDGESDTSVPQLGLDWLNRGNNHVLGLRTTWRRGIDALDATIFDPQTPLDALFNPTGADGEFDMVLTQGLYLYRLNQVPGFHGLHDRGQLVLRATVQLSNDPLMSLEKIAIGGANTVRGYPENLLVRDNGVATTLELQLPVWGYRDEPHLLNLVVAPFIDYGRSWDEVDTDVTSAVRDTDEARDIVGAGVGLIWQPLRGLRAQVYWGQDVSDNFDGDDPRDLDSDDDLQDDGFHFSVVYGVAF